MLTVIGPKGGRTIRVLWTLEELGLPYSQEVARPHSVGMYNANPLGQAPALRDGDTVLTDSLAIMNYLADRAGGLTYPPGTAERALMDARINFILTEMEAPIWLMARHGFVLPKEERVPGMRAVAEADFARAEAKFETLLGDSSFFGGATFSLADIFAADMARWAEQAKVLLTSPIFRDYYDRMSARPAWERTVQSLA
ncbi:MAG: glutathione S-transferase family protein [Pseudomonadota bacterium]